MTAVILAATAALCALCAVAAGHVALGFRRRWLTATAERDAARAEAMTARHDATASRAALSLAQTDACAVCRDAWVMPRDHRRRLSLS